MPGKPGIARKRQTAGKPRQNAGEGKRPRAADGRSVGDSRRSRAGAAGAIAALELLDDRRGRKALRLRARLDLNRETFARMIPLSTRALAALEAGQPPTESVRRKLNELHRLVEALSQVIRPEFIGPWLTQPNDAFDGLKPLEVIERGEADRLWQMVYEMGSGMPG